MTSAPQGPNPVAPAERATPAPTRSARWARFALESLLGQRLRLLWLLAAAGLLIFGGFRLGLMLASRDALTGVSADDLARCFWVGLRYDGVAVGYALLPLAAVLSLAPNVAFTRAWFRRILQGYVALMVMLAAMIGFVGAFFFRQFGARMNWLAIEYADHSSEAARFIWQNYPVVLALIGAAVVIALVYLLAGWLLCRGRTPHGPIWTRPILAAVLIGLGILAVRGGVDHHPLRLGAAYFCDNKTVTQLALNDVYTVVQAVRSHKQDSQDVAQLKSGPSFERATQVISQMLMEDQDRPSTDPRRPLDRQVDTGRPMRDYNVVVIVMEGMAGKPVGALGHSPSHTPCFDELCREGLFFNHVYAVGNRTNRGMAAVLCSYPDRDSFSILKRSRAQGAFLTLPGIFRQRGYHTMMLYGGNPDFDNMQGFFGSNGVEQFIGQADLHAGKLTSDWGAADEVLFRKADETFRAMGSQKFFAIILTVSNHEPFDAPIGRVEFLPDTTLENKRANAYRYADWALGQFFRQARQADYFRNTIFVLVSDHGRGFDRRRLVDVPGYRVPLLVYAPELYKPRVIDTIGSQTDIGPTVLGLLGGRFEHSFLGRDLLAAKGEGFAFMYDDERPAMIRGPWALVVPPGKPPLLFRTDETKMDKVPPDQADPALVESMQLQMRSFEATSYYLYLNDSYSLPAVAQAREAGARGTHHVER